MRSTGPVPANTDDFYIIDLELFAKPDTLLINHESTHGLTVFPGCMRRSIT